MYKIRFLFFVVKKIFIYREEVKLEVLVLFRKWEFQLQGQIVEELKLVVNFIVDDELMWIMDKLRVEYEFVKYVFILDFKQLEINNNDVKQVIIIRFLLLYVKNVRFIYLCVQCFFVIVKIGFQIVYLCL